LWCDSKEVKLSELDTYKLGAMTTPPENIAVPPAPGAGTTGTVPSEMAPPTTTMAALMPLLATSPSYIQPPTPIMG
jgi:hypothetical protein